MMLEGIFEQTVFSLSTAAAVIALLSSIVGYVVQRRQRTHILSITEEHQLNTVLGSDDIQQLGDYLEQTLSDVTIFQYSADPKVANRVDRYLEHVQDYVGTTEEVERATEDITESTGEMSARGIIGSDAPQEVRPIIEELRTGETWNALARLRRYIEMTLRELAKTKGYDERRLRSAGQIIRLLRQEGHLDEGTAHSLEYAIALCNRAVHGLDVSQDEAWGAVNEGLYALRRLS